MRRLSLDTLNQFLADGILFLQPSLSSLSLARSRSLSLSLSHRLSLTTRPAQPLRKRRRHFRGSDVASAALFCFVTMLLGVCIAIAAATTATAATAVQYECCCGDGGGRWWSSLPSSSSRS